MTVLSLNASVKRETRAMWHGRPLMVEVTGHELIMREKGRRFRVSVPLVACYETGWKILAREQRAAKLAKRKERAK